MRIDNLFGLVFFITFAVAVFRYIDAWKEQAIERLRVLEKALADPNLDSESRRAVLDALERRRGGGAMTWVFGLGWLGFFAGIAMLIVGEGPDEMRGAVMTACGFGLVSLPLALREIDTRRRA